MSINASLRSILRGSSKPIARLLDSGHREYFRFQNGQIRRQLGEGHSLEERATRRELRRIARHQVLSREPIGKLAAAVISHRWASQAAQIHEPQYA